ncbi:MAG: hypothetical protein ACI4EF_08960 [Coprococcus sp.]
MSNIKYHYTSVDGMSSILKSKKLRLTRSEFLNDPADCRVLYTLINDYFEYKNSEIQAKLNTPDLQQVYERAPLIKYVSFLQRHIHLYVLSLTDNNDQMSMWNYYGSGGMQLCIDVEVLVKEITKGFTSDNQYIAFSHVHYISDGETVDDVSFEPFCNFRLDSKSKSNIFLNNSKRVGKNGLAHPLYQTTELSGFVDTYITGYIESLKYLLREKQISVSTSDLEIFTKVYSNTNSLNNYYEFKKDLTLYLMVLSAFIKNNTYGYEKEFRIVLFENSLQQSINVEYAVQSLQNQKYMRPFTETTQLETSYIKGVTLSPLTRNLPIDDDLYMETISEFVESQTGSATAVNWQA